MEGEFRVTFGPGGNRAGDVHGWWMIETINHCRSQTDRTRSSLIQGSELHLQIVGPFSHSEGREGIS